MSYLSTSGVILAWVAAFGVFGCTKVCAPGQQVVCACRGSEVGMQSCNPKGESCGACICPGDGGAAGQAARTAAERPGRAARAGAGLRAPMTAWPGIRGVTAGHYTPAPRAT